MAVFGASGCVDAEFSEGVAGVLSGHSGYVPEAVVSACCEAADGDAAVFVGALGCAILLLHNPSLPHDGGGCKLRYNPGCPILRVWERERKSERKWK